MINCSFSFYLTRPSFFPFITTLSTFVFSWTFNPIPCHMYIRSTLLLYPSTIIATPPLVLSGASVLNVTHRSSILRLSMECVSVNIVANGSLRLMSSATYLLLCTCLPSTPTFMFRILSLVMLINRTLVVDMFFMTYTRPTPTYISFLASSINFSF